MQPASGNASQILFCLNTERLFDRLQEAGLTSPRAMLDVATDRLQELIKPVGFFRRKTEFLKRVSQILIDEYKSDIPASVEVSRAQLDGHSLPVFGFRICVGCRVLDQKWLIWLCK